MRILGLLLVLAMSWSVTFGQTAEEVLDRAAKTYANLKSLQVRSTIQVNMEAPGMSQKMEQQHEGVYLRPNLMRLSWKGGSTGEMKWVCDGKTFYQEISAIKRVQQQPAPKDFKGFRQQGFIGQSGIVDELVLLSGGSWREVLKNPKLTGRQKLGGREVYVIKGQLAQAKGSQTLWIGTKDDLIWKYQAETEVQAMDQTARQTVTETYTQLKLNPSLTKASFLYKLPQGFRTDGVF